MRPFPLLLVLFLAITLAACEVSDKDKDSSEQESWWSGFKGRLKKVLSRWREDVKGLWDEVLAKTRDLKSWTGEMFEGLKEKLKQLVESRVPDDEKNEIETFIEKLKVPTEKPEKIIDP